MNITEAQIRKICPHGRSDIISGSVKTFNQYAEQYGVTNYLRVCHWWAQAAHESANLQTTTEFASGRAYEGRKDLGNTQPGDGVRYKGRGLFQITGRANYKTFGDLIGVDIVDDPASAATVNIATQTALAYWQQRKLSSYADKDDILTITKRINGGYNGLAERKAYLATAKVVFKNIDLGASSSPPDGIGLGASGPEVQRMQDQLVSLGYHLTPDGTFGPHTEEALSAFQASHNLTSTGILDSATEKVLFT